MKIENKIQEMIKNVIFVKDDESGMRLDKLMADRFPVINRDSWQKRIQDGMVSVESRKTKPSMIMHKNEQIEFYYTKKDEPEVDFNVSVLYEDETLLVLDKPANLPVHPSGIYYKNTLLEFLKNKYGKDFTPRPAHRLDRETSGVMILAKSRKAASILQKSFEKREIYKEYAVFVEGKFESYKNAEGVLTADNESSVKKKRRYIDGANASDYKNCETSRTEFFPAEIHGNISFVKAVIHTGRMHQIRATLFSLGYPVIGDRLYGVDDTLYIKLIEDNKTEEDYEILKMRRTALHCSLMKFKHPVSGEEMAVQSELPEDMKFFLQTIASAE